jgi:uncharacterized cupin superfamily protein
MREATMEKTDVGLVPASEGWFVVNLAETAAKTRRPGAVYAPLEGPEHEFAQFGINVHVLEDGVPNCLYHRESAQEAFLVLDGEPLLIIEGEERRLRRWDFVHCPPGATHVFVGPGAILMVGTRDPDEQVHYPVEEIAARHGASVPRPSDDPAEAYPSAGWSRDYEPIRTPWP